MLMGALTVVGSAVGGYIMFVAALSPCPLLVNDTAGGAVIVSSPSFTVFTCLSGSMESGAEVIM